MPAGKKQGRKSGKDANSKLKWETARELGLEDDLSNNPGDELTAREAGRIGGNMVRKLIKAGEESFQETQSQQNKRILDS